MMNMATQSMYKFRLVSVASIFQRNLLNSDQILMLIGPRRFTRLRFACNVQSTPKFGKISAEHDVGAGFDEMDGIGEIAAELDGDAAAADTEGEEDGEVLGDDEAEAVVVIVGETEADREAVKETVGDGEAPIDSEAVGV